LTSPRGVLLFSAAKSDEQRPSNQQRVFISREETTPMKNPHPISGKLTLLVLLLMNFGVAACSSGSSSMGGPGPLNVSLSTSMALAPQDNTPAVVTASVSGNTSAAMIAVSGVPSGTTSQIVQPTAAAAGTITLISGPPTAAGTYPLKVTATAGTQTGSQNLTLVVAVAGSVSKTVDSALGVNGKLQEFMSTSFQPAEWDNQFFQNHPNTEPGQLNTLGPKHIRIQGISQAVPMKSNTGTASDWDFTTLDAIVQPILGTADHSPEFQIAVAPAWMQNSAGQLDMTNHLNDFVQYSANLVRYYNTGGFTVGSTHFQSASPNKITWWGIFNEYNINGLMPAQYVQLYNAMVPAMLAVDSTIKFSAQELADFDSGNGDPRNNLPTFVMPANQGGVNAQVNIVSTHFYSSCDQTNTDTQLFNTVPGFVNDVSYFYQELKTRPDLAAVPVWVTENNVNADFANSNGNSTCNPQQKFVTDQRGTSAFFAAWRPYVFSQLGKVGNQALYHWDYDADAQYGEVDFNSDNKYLSYWVDYWLGQLYPQSPSAPDILDLALTENTTVEALATMNSDNSVLVMIADRAVAAPSDNNGTGAPRTVVMDISALGNLTSASQLNIVAGSDLTNGPQPVTITPAAKLVVTLPGYGVSFLILKP
jgi:hypothetical protein